MNTTIIQLIIIKLQLNKYYNYTIHYYKTSITWILLLIQFIIIKHFKLKKKKFKSKGRLINKKYKRKENAKNKTRTNGSKVLKQEQRGVKNKNKNKGE